MMTLSEQLREWAKRDDDCMQRLVGCSSGSGVTYRRVAELVDDIEAENAALTKRVAELESQLAWTPVSDGLPTEPGVYAFGDPDSDDKSAIVFWSLSHIGGTHRWWFGECGYVSPTDRHHDVTHFRRIELPKEGET